MKIQDNDFPLTADIQTGPGLSHKIQTHGRPRAADRSR
jgi:hypothetical protein